jgi:hypothetical protein
MNYLRSFLEEKKRAEKPIPPTDKTDKSTIGSFGSGSSALSSTAFSPAEEAEIDRLARADGYKPLPPIGAPAYSILETCRRHGVALTLDQDGSLRIGNADGSGQEPSLWPSLLMAMEAHLEAVTALVGAGWHLHADVQVTTAARAAFLSERPTPGLGIGWSLLELQSLFIGWSPIWSPSLPMVVPKSN